MMFRLIQVMLATHALALMWLAPVIIQQNTSAADVAGVHIEEQGGALTVNIDGSLFFRYVFREGRKPYCWPIIGPTGDPVTRAYPMQNLQGEQHDHLHQRSHWFTHGDVNGIDFWSESDKAGRQVHRKFDLVKSGPKLGQIRAVTDWFAPGAGGEKICEDTREYRIYASTNPRIVDLKISLRASEGPLVLGDTKEGSFGYRVATTMRSDKGGKIVNSRGHTGKEAWGKSAEWVDYSGPVNGRIVGITIMDHPSSFRHPTFWHVRTYGLFAANPFGLHHFYGDNSKDGSHELANGESITFRYRVLIHAGHAHTAHVAEAYDKYVKMANRGHR